MTSTKKLLAVSISLLLGAQSASALNFSDNISFGDSLSDSGAFVGNPDAGNGGTFTTNPGNVWTQNLADHFGNTSVSNNPNNPNTSADGNNYAQGGAQVTIPIGIGQTPSPQNAIPINIQVGNYLATTPSGNRNALYSLWGGANDIFFNLALIGNGLPINDAIGNVGTSAAQLISLADQLDAAGARYIVVPNLPDIGATPSQVLQVVADAGAGNPGLNDALIGAITVLAQQANSIEEQALIRAQALAVAEVALGFPAGSLTPAFEGISSLSTGLVQAFNATLAAAIGGSGANIIPLDAFTMFNEIIADPASFGLVNATGVACTTASALPCNAATLIDPRTPEGFLFADGVHPTTAGHRIVADYAISVISAPALIANLPEASLGLTRAHQDLLLTQLGTQAFSENWSVFGNVALGGQDISAGQAIDADSENGQIMLGFGRSLSNGLVIGAAIEKSYSNVDFSGDMGSFEVDAFQLSGFLHYQNGGFFANGLATYGLQADIDDIERVISLGNGTRIESGNSEADVYALKAEIGATLLKSDRFRAGPFGSINYISVDVDGYAESGSRATSMNFGDQDRDSLLAELGIFGDILLGTATIHSAISREQELDDDSRTVSAGLNSLDGSRFNLYDINPEDGFWKFDIGIGAQVSDNVFLGASFLYRKGDDDNNQQLVNAGFRVDL